MITVVLKDVVKVRMLMGEQDISQKDLSVKCNISQAYLSQVLTQKRNPSVSAAYKIAKALNTEIEEIFFIDIDSKRYIQAQ